MDGQGEVGVEVDFRPVQWPVNLVIGVRGSAVDQEELGIDFEGRTSEITLGVTKIWEPNGPTRPFLGGGVYWTLGRHFNVGVDAQYSWPAVTSFDIDANAGGAHQGLLLGYHR